MTSFVIAENAWATPPIDSKTRGKSMTSFVIAAIAYPTVGSKPTENALSAC